MKKKDLQEQYLNKINNDILPQIDFHRLDLSCNSQDNRYAEEVLKDLHKAFVEVYGTDQLECDGDYEFVYVPAVVQARNTGHLTIGIVNLDLESSGEHGGTHFFSPVGVIERNDSKEADSYVKENYIPYDYWYTLKIHGDIHVDPSSAPEAVADLLHDACDQHRLGMEMK